LGWPPTFALLYWWAHHLTLEQISYPAVFGLLMIVLGWQTITIR
jgi:hypothetical protein